jgi:hypothetical protein
VPQAREFGFHDAALVFPLFGLAAPEVLGNPAADIVVVASIQFAEGGASALFEPVRGLVAFAFYLTVGVNGR